jgi:hypothetical protein
MKLVHITFQEQYTEAVEGILGHLEVASWVRHRRVDGRDLDGRHEGSQAFPGAVTVIEVRMRDEVVGELLERLEAYRTAKRVHRHLEALVLPVERMIGPRSEEEEEDAGGEEGR